MIIIYSYICDRSVKSAHWLVRLTDDLYTDFATDSIIQSTLRRELGNDVTLLTIAHRLHTIMDSDKIVSMPTQFLLLMMFIYRILDGARCWPIGEYKIVNTFFDAR